jgi:lipoprotein NlpD
MQTYRQTSRIAAALAAAVSLAACTMVPLTPRDRGFYPLETPPAQPTETAPPPQAKTALFVRPAQGRTSAAFDGKNNRGMDIAGNPGDPIVAAADGRVIYAGDGLRNYGNLIIIKHNDIYLTAYAHVRVALVRENEVVRQGQKIAEMGSSGADRVKLHFEIRKNDAPVNPEPYLAGDLP